jgi:branched-subunit amino acid aminotransferase/4-amino-4-deoxychorismate lyase
MSCEKKVDFQLYEVPLIGGGTMGYCPDSHRLDIERWKRHCKEIGMEIKDYKEENEKKKVNVKPKERKPKKYKEVRLWVEK